MYRNHLSPPQFPAPWAADWGEDNYGLWMTCALHRARQIFRWIRPGTFMMGAAAEKGGRSPWLGRVTQHRVTLSKGFWLADTAVTQEMWTAAMGENPACFTGAGLPVERVSWHDAQAFIRQLNTLLPGFRARLPFEAEWEYACRAGTATPFSFGNEVTPEQVNYNGRYPCSRESQGGSGVPGLYRRETVPVKSLPCNSWGMYEMHGNVREWCQDCWQPDLTADPAVDPQGPVRGYARLVRGGSWADDAWSARSACRESCSPDFRSAGIGLRLAVNCL
ncbi:MAG: formylglycine-generating enzyme family protein [Candidatus Electrothrix sp. YB6]